MSAFVSTLNDKKADELNKLLYTDAIYITILLK